MKHQVIAIWILNDEGKLLIQKRAESVKRWPGLWGVTGGGVEPGETSVQACIREVAEELGLRLTPDDIEFIYRVSSETNDFDVFFMVRDIELANLVLNPREVSEVGWFSADEIGQLVKDGRFVYDCIDELKTVMEHYCRGGRSRHSANKY